MIKKVIESRRYLFKYYYIGLKKFHGSQRQKSLLTIEECLLNALKERDYIKSAKSSRMDFASRTDRFVSARGAAFSFNTEKHPILMEINTALPMELGIWAYAEVPTNFLSRFNADLRHYKYIVPQPLSFLENNFSINLKIMLKACKKLEGKHDFKNFAKIEKNENKTIRDLDYVNISVVNDYLIFDFKSRAYLRQQIRRMVKKILKLGMKEINYDEFLLLFDDSKEISYQPADASGLILWDIKYDKKIKFIIDLKSKERMINYFFNQELKFGHKQQLFKILQQNNFS